MDASQHKQQNLDINSEFNSHLKIKRPLMGRNKCQVKEQTRRDTYIVRVRWYGQEVKQRAHVALAPPPGHVTRCGLSQPARHAASVWSRTIMKKQPSAGAAAEADLSNIHRAFPPRLTRNTADRWIEATTQLFLSLNGEEDGTCSGPGPTARFIRLLYCCQIGAEDRRD